LVVLWVGLLRAAAFFVSPTGEFDHISLNDVSDDSVQQWMFGSAKHQARDAGWIGTYLEYREGKVPKSEWMEQIEQTLSVLYDRIMKPIHQWLDAHADAQRISVDPDFRQSHDRTTHRIALIAGGALGLLPLHAARWEDKDGRIHHLVEHLDIAFAPSAWVLKRCAERDGKESLPILTLSDPSRPDSDPLPFSIWEAEQIKQMVQTKYGAGVVDNLEAASATLQRVRELLPTHPIVHFACHGQWDFQRPLQSALMLAGNDYLSLGELLSKLDMNQAKLVVLSACESGAGYRPGSMAEEYLGLPAGFIIAGSQAVVGSLWSVSDPPTALLMKRFYNNLLDGMGTSEALREAQLWLQRLSRNDAIAIMREGLIAHTNVETEELTRKYTDWVGALGETPFAHPYHWAAFAAFGAPSNYFTKEDSQRLSL
jgi:CHAT domain-containing protein